MFKYAKIINCIVVVVVLLLIIPSCTAESPYPEDMWTQHIYPGVDSTYDFGSPALYWNNAYIRNLNVDSIIGFAVPATLVVASAASLDPTRADYQCDGIADDVQIQAALDALPATGGRVVLLEGPYLCTVNILIPADATLEGQGYLSTVLGFDGPTVNQAITINGDTVQVRDLSIVIIAGCGPPGARPNGIHADTKDGVILDGLFIAGDKSVGIDGGVTQQNGIYFNDTAQSLITNCVIVEFIESGIHLRNFSDENMIVNSICLNNDDMGIWLFDDSAHCLIEGNFTSGSNDGICVFGTDFTTIIGNDCSGNLASGIDLQSGSCDNIVTGNQCSTNDNYGIYAAWASDRNVITGNQCFDNGNHGIYNYRSSYCTITGNICSDNDIDGIQIEGDTGNADYNTITGNVCYNNGDDGLELVGDVDCNYNVVSGNQLISNTGTDYVNNGNQTEYWGGSTESWIELRPDFDFSIVRSHGVPTQIERGVYTGFSLPIYSADHEELFFEICIPQRWNRESDIDVHVYCCLSQAEDTKNFNLELCWEHITVGTDVVPVTCNSVTTETATGATAAQYQTYVVEFTIDYDIDAGDAIIEDDLLGLRIRRLAASANEIGGEIIVLHTGVIFQRNKVGEPIP